MNWTLEVVVVPVTDVDRAKSSTRTNCASPSTTTRREPRDRFVQLTPPGSGCSIVIGEGVPPMQAGSLKGLQLVVSDLLAAPPQLVERGVEVSEVQVFDESPATQPIRSTTSASSFSTTRTAMAGPSSRSRPEADHGSTTRTTARVVAPGGASREFSETVSVPDTQAGVRVRRSRASSRVIVRLPQRTASA